MLTPVASSDLADLQAIKADPRVFAIMLGGVRSPMRTVEELAEDIAFWGRHGCGMWSVRQGQTGRFLGLTGFMERQDGRGISLRFAFWPQAQGFGYAREAAGAALRFGHEAAGLERIVAVARRSNLGSRTVLGGIGMREAATFERDGYTMILFESVRRHPHPRWA